MRAFESVGSAAVRAAPVGCACELYRGRATQAGDEDLDFAVAFEDARKSGHQTAGLGAAAAMQQVFDHRFVLVQGLVTSFLADIAACQGICSSRTDDAPAVGWWGLREEPRFVRLETESGVVIRSAAGTSSQVLAAFLVDCPCGKRLLVGDTLGDTPEEERAAWRETLAEVAWHLDIPLLWESDHAQCPRCGTPVCRVSEARR
jgi:hypothetical protein